LHYLPCLSKQKGRMKLNPTPQDRPVFTVSQNQKSEGQSPSSVVFVDYLHMPEKPFCPNERCPCHQNQAQIAVLLDAIRAGEMTLREAANFAEGKTL